MKLFAISGLGADERVFQYLNIEHELIPLNWIQPHKNESIEAYAHRFIKEYKLEIETDFGIIGVSFGGLVAIEISKIISPKVTIQISSAQRKQGLRIAFRLIGKLGLIKLLPKQIFNPPKKLAHFVFGTENKELLNSILDDTDLSFAKWAVNELCTWKNEQSIPNHIKICGTNDKLIPPDGDHSNHLITGGEHLMIIDRSEEISNLINKELKKEL